MSTSNRRVLMPIVDGFEQTEALATVDILRRAGVEVVTAGVGKRSATSSHGVTIETDALVDDVLVQPWDAIVLPGGPGTPRLNEVAGLHDRLRAHAAGGKLTAAICAAPSVLAAAGLLDGRTAACHPSVEQALASSGARVVREAVAWDDPVLTSRGVGTALGFALALASRLAGEAKAREIAEAICYDWRG